MDKRFIGALIAIVISLGAIFAFSGGNKTNSSSGIQFSQPIMLKAKARTKLLWWSMAIMNVHFVVNISRLLNQFQQIYNAQISFQFRNLPLTEIHPNAFAGARAAEAAGLMGQFWQMHDFFTKIKILGLIPQVRKRSLLVTLSNSV